MALAALRRQHPQTKLINAAARETLRPLGLVQSTPISHGHGNFTVHQFDRYMRRNRDLAPPRPAVR